jgi:hypothetical protein
MPRESQPCSIRPRAGGEGFRRLRYFELSALKPSVVVQTEEQSLLGMYYPEANAIDPAPAPCERMGGVSHRVEKYQRRPRKAQRLDRDLMPERLERARDGSIVPLDSGLNGQLRILRERHRIGFSLSPKHRLLFLAAVQQAYLLHSAPHARLADAFLWWCESKGLPRVRFEVERNCLEIAPADDNAASEDPWVRFAPQHGNHRPGLHQSRTRSRSRHSFRLSVGCHAHPVGHHRGNTAFSEGTAVG